MRKSVVFVWSDRALFVGDRSETAVHAHNAVELSIALDAQGIDMGDSRGNSHEHIAGAVVASNCKHQLRVRGPKVAVLYLESQSDIARALQSWLGEREFAPIPTQPGMQDFAQLLRRSSTLELAEQAIDSLLQALVPRSPRHEMDSRIREVIAYLGTQLDGHQAAPRLAEVAARVGLSESRLGHLFKAQLGLPLRRYMLWMRLRSALMQALQGGSMTEAAHAAGFADAAHFTRTCQSMFGLPPSAFAPVDDLLISKTENH